MHPGKKATYPKRLTIIYALLTAALVLGAAPASAIGDNGGDEDQDKDEIPIRCEVSTVINVQTNAPTGKSPATVDAGPFFDLTPALAIGDNGGDDDQDKDDKPTSAKASTVIKVQTNAPSGKPSATCNAAPFLAVTPALAIGDNGGDDDQDKEDKPTSAKASTVINVQTDALGGKSPATCDAISRAFCVSEPRTNPLVA